MCSAAAAATACRLPLCPAAAASITLPALCAADLWTDAFGVCNYITLACETGERRYLDQAQALIAGGRGRGAAVCAAGGSLADGAAPRRRGAVASVSRQCSCTQRAPAPTPPILRPVLPQRCMTRWGGSGAAVRGWVAPPTTRPRAAACASASRTLRGTTTATGRWGGWGAGCRAGRGGRLGGALRWRRGSPEAPCRSSRAPHCAHVSPLNLIHQQYFHYLTKWAFALNRMSLAAGEPRFNRWAVQVGRAWPGGAAPLLPSMRWVGAGGSVLGRPTACRTHCHPRLHSHRSSWRRRTPTLCTAAARRRPACGGRQGASLGWSGWLAWLLLRGRGSWVAWAGGGGPRRCLLEQSERRRCHSASVDSLLLALPPADLNRHVAAAGAERGGAAGQGFRCTPCQRS